MVIEIFDLPYLPLNRAKRLARGMLIKTDLCREFEKDLTARMALLDFTKLLETFKNGNNYLEVAYFIFVPVELYFTKEGKISNRACDTDSIKVLQDTVFRSIGIDDKFIRDLHVISRPSHDGLWNYRIEIKVKETGEIKCQKEELNLL